MDGLGVNFKKAVEGTQTGELPTTPSQNAITFRNPWSPEGKPVSTALLAPSSPPPPWSPLSSAPSTSISSTSSGGSVFLTPTSPWNRPSSSSSSSSSSISSLGLGLSSSPHGSAELFPSPPPYNAQVVPFDHKKIGDIERCDTHYDEVKRAWASAAMSIRKSSKDLKLDVAAILKDTTPHDLAELALELLHNSVHESKSSKAIKFLETLQYFYGVFDVLSQADCSHLAVIWGGIKLMMMVGHRGSL
jgi:hypothetical protein